MQISDNKSKKQDPWTFKLHKISIWEKYYLIFVEKEHISSASPVKDKYKLNNNPMFMYLCIQISSLHHGELSFLLLQDAFQYMEYGGGFFWGDFLVDTGS